MSSLKKHKVICLPTNKASRVVFHKDSNTFQFYERERTVPPNEFHQHHLYAISDEEIKEGDWFIKMNYNGGKPTLYQERKAAFMNSEWLNSSDVKDCFKVIATSDKSLEIDHNYGSIDYEEKIIDCNDYIPQFTDSSIHFWIEEYNKGNKIEWVNLEYEEKVECDCYYTKFCKSERLDNNTYCKDWEKDRLKLKLRNDNTVICHSIKNSWNREEVEEKCRLAYKAGIAFTGPSWYGVNTELQSCENEWIEKNL